MCLVPDGAHMHLDLDETLSCLEHQFSPQGHSDQLPACHTEDQSMTSDLWSLG